MMFCSSRCGPDRLGHIERGPRVLGLGADVQEQRPVLGKRPPRRLDPVAGPLQILRPRPPIVIGPVLDTEIVRRGGDDGVDGAGAEGVQGLDGVAVEEPQPGPAALEFGVRFGNARGTVPRLYRADTAVQCQLCS